MSVADLLRSVAGARVACTVAVLGDVLPPRLDPGTEAEYARAAARLAPLAADVAIANLEAPVGVDGLDPAPKPGLGFNLEAPEASLALLTRLRVAAVGLANNHAYDFGADGVERTVAALARRGIAAVGAGRTLAEPPAVAVVERAGVRVGIWAAAAPEPSSATARRAGVEPVSLERGREAVARLEEAGASFRIALLHAGVEGTNRPDPDDVALAEALARAGFDLVGACHSHRVSGWSRVERSAGPAFCFHGLGSAVSPVGSVPAEREGLAVLVGLDRTGAAVRVALRPIVLDARGFGRVPEPDEARAVLDRVDALSRELAEGVYRRRFYAESSRGFVRAQLADARLALARGGPRGLAAKLRRARPRHAKRLVLGLLARRAR